MVPFTIVAALVGLAVPSTEWIVAAIVALTPVIVNIIVWFAQKYTPTIPAWIKQLVALGLSALATYLGGVVVADPMLAAVIALASLGIHALINEFSKATGIKAALFPKK